MGEIKTKVTDSSVKDFIENVQNDTKRADSFALLKIFSEATGEKAKMWGPSIIGFGQYHYKSERSSQEGDWPLVAFSPRKASLTLYITMPGVTGFDDLLAKLGKHKTSKGCLYIHKLADVDIDVLKELIKTAYQKARETLM